MKIDLHVHIDRANPLILSDMVQFALERGIDGIGAIHHHYAEIDRDLLEEIDHLNQTGGFRIFPGVELTRNIGHFLVFGISPSEVNQMVKERLTNQQILDYVDKNNGVAIAAHPFDKKERLGNSIFELKNLHIIETINGKLPDDRNQLAYEAGRKMGCFGVGGSDAHYSFQIGRAYTIFQDEIHSLQDLLTALKNGHYQAQKG